VFLPVVTDPEIRPVLDKLREHLAHADRLLPLAMVGLVTGLVTGGVIIAFRRLTESSQTMLTPLDDPDAFEWLPWEYRLGLPVAGGLLIGLIFQRAAVGSRQVGVVHVMEYRHDPVAISLSRTGVGAVMGRRLQAIPCRGKTKALPDVEARTPDWVLATDDQRIVCVVPGDALLKYMKSSANRSDSVEDYDLLEIDGARSEFSMVSLQATLRDALERMDRASTDVVLVTRAGTSAPANVRGVLTRDQIEAGVRYRV
jgi:hypothetical protein